ncbi:MAG: SMP-30/gluconolactonase/LRE family protein [Pseudomonadota bacterium]
MAERKTETLIEGLCFGEGPRWRDGRLWFSDMHDHRILTVDLDGNVETVLEVPTQPSGLGWLPGGDLLFVSMLDRRLMRLGPDGPVLHADLSGFTDFPCNDMVVDAAGTAYVGNFGFDSGAVRRGEAEAAGTRLIRVTASGEASQVGVPLIFPNGTVITPDAKTLIVAETFGFRLSAFDIAPDGSLSGHRIWADLGKMHPDGMCLDAEGAIWVAVPGSHAVVRVAGGGELIETIPLENHSYACMLGGDDGRTLFVLTAETSGAEKTRALRSGRVEIVRVDVPGVGLP